MKKFGEGNYELGNIQMVETTEDFKTMSQSVRECQTETTFEDCVTKKYLELLIKRCSCLPFHLQNYSSNNDHALCTKSNSSCVADVEIPKQLCLKPCDGMHVDVKKHPVKIVQLPEYQLLLDDYLNYTSFGEEDLQLQHKTSLKFVRIFFGTTRYNKITKDEAAKFMEVLSAIGGTMGLLTGFSIISGVEILYYAATLIASYVIKKRQ